jgi:autoinducer 2-degrading protein
MSQGGAAMYIVHVYIHIKPEFVDAFKKISIANEPGIARFDVIQQVDDPTRFMLLEVYQNVDAPALHRETQHYKTWKEAAEGMMVEPRTRLIFNNIFPSDPGWG